MTRLRRTQQNALLEYLRERRRQTTAEAVRREHERRRVQRQQSLARAELAALDRAEEGGDGET